MKNCKKLIKQHRGQRKVHRLPKKPNLRKEAFFTPLHFA